MAAFPGSSGNTLQIGASSDFNYGTGNFTVELFANEVQDLDSSLYQFGDGNPTIEIRIDENDKPMLECQSVEGTDYQISSSDYDYKIKTWSHLAGVKNGANLTLYLDGVAVATRSDLTGNFGNSTDTTYIGGRVGSKPYGGYLGPLRVSNSARYTEDFTPPTTSFTNDGNTKLLIQNGTDGSQTFTDSSSSSHSITVNGSPRWFAPKVGAGAMVFDGTGDYFSVPDSVDWDFGAGDFTIEFWAKIGASAPDGSMLSHYDVSSQRSWSVVLDATNNELEFVYSTDGGSATTAAFSWSYSEHTWYLVSICRSGADLKAFIDGTQIGSTYDISTSDLHNSTSTLTIGGDVRSGMGYLFKGAIDDLRIVRTALRTSNWTASTSAFTDSINTVLLLNADINQGTWAQDTSTGLAISTDSRMKFDGTGDYLITSAEDFLDGNWTVECWFNGNAWPSGIKGLISLDYDGGSGSSNNAMNFGVSNGSMALLVSSDVTSGWNVVNTTAGAPPVGAWHHGAVVFNGSTYKVYLNGSEVISVTSSTAVASQASSKIIVGTTADSSSSQAWDGYLDEIRVSSTARYSGTFTPKARGEAFEADANTKLLIHSDYTGGLGADSSGNYNNFTATGLVATDQMIDTPTNSFATFNALSYGDNGGNFELREGNLQAYMTSGVGKTHSTFSLFDDGCYWEMMVGDTGGGYGIALLKNANLTTSSQLGADSYSEIAYRPSSGNLDIDGSTAATYASASAGDIINFAFKSGRLYVGKSNTWFNSGNPAGGSGYVNSSAVTGDWCAACSLGANSPNYGSINFGADSSFAGKTTAQGKQDGNDKGDFYYEPPSGFLALCTDNLPDPEIALPGEHFNTVLYSSDNTNNRAITGVGFQPNMLWIKRRNGTSAQAIYDTTRGATDAETPRLSADTGGAQQLTTDELDSFDSDGFTIDTGINGTGQTWVAWNWKESATSGFDIVSYTGTGSAHTIAHSLGVKPDLIFVKDISDTNDWAVYNSVGGATLYLQLNDTSPYASPSTGRWNSTEPTSSVFSVGDAGSVNTDTNNYMAYLWASIEGYSKVGSYTGNANADGTFIYTGFRPAFLIAKNTGASGKPWVMYDDKRDTYNEMYKQLVADDNAAANTSEGRLDFVSNGIKWRIGDSYHNDGSFIYIAFAESPFKYSNAR